MTVRIGIDYDEPIFPWYDYAHDAAIEHGLANPDQDPPTLWDPSSIYGCDLDDWWKVINNEIDKGVDGMYGRPIKPGIAAQLRRLTNRGYEVHIVTARGVRGPRKNAIKRLTQIQLDKEIPFVTSVRFTHDKGDAIREMGLNYFLDDREDYYHEASAAGARAYLLNERWNEFAQVPESRRLDSTREYVDLVVRVQENLDYKKRQLLVGVTVP